MVTTLLPPDWDIAACCAVRFVTVDGAATVTVVDGVSSQVVPPSVDTRTVYTRGVVPVFAGKVISPVALVAVPVTEVAYSAVPALFRNAAT